LYRNWTLSMQILKNVQLIFCKGKAAILKCLLDIHLIFANDSDYRYILNDLYITDYCVWIQGVDDSTFAAYADAIKKISGTISKADVDLNLDELELAASLAMLEVDEKKEDLDSDDEETEKSVQ